MFPMHNSKGACFDRQSTIQFGTPKSSRPACTSLFLQGLHDGRGRAFSTSLDLLRLRPALLLPLSTGMPALKALERVTIAEDHKQRIHKHSNSYELKKLTTSFQVFLHTDKNHTHEMYPLFLLCINTWAVSNTEFF